MENVTLVTGKLSYIISVVKVLEADNAFLGFFGTSRQVLELISS